MNLFLLQQCDIRDTCAAHLPIVFSQIGRHRQYKHNWSCVSQYCGRFLRGNLFGFYKALLLASEFPTFHERFFMVCLNSSSSGSMKKIPRNLLASSSFGFSMVHFCFAFRFDASDICFHISGHTSSGREVVYFLVSLLLDQVYPSGGLSFNRINLVRLVHASDNFSFSIHVPVIINMFSVHTSNNVRVVLETSMYVIGTRNDSLFGNYILTRGST